MSVTKVRRYAVFPLMLLLLFLGACSGSGNVDAAWLIGKWELSHNPENDDEDILVFNRDGKFHIETVDGRTLPGQYVVEDNKVKIVLPLRKKVVETSFDVDPARQRLTYENGAYYTKQEAAP